MEEMTIHLLAVMKGIGEITMFTAYKNNPYFGDSISIEGITEDGKKFSLDFSMKKEDENA